jgi:hypothetical protein
VGFAPLGGAKPNGARESCIMSKEAFANGLGKYLPPSSIDIVHAWLLPHRVKLKITKPRTSKLGDFRVRSKKAPSEISVNGNLNPFAFLITLTHEIAHLKDFETRGTLREAHGAHWKKEYSKLLIELRQASVFPADILPAIDEHIHRPKAASCSDARLLDALREYDPHQWT